MEFGHKVFDAMSPWELFENFYGPDRIIASFPHNFASHDSKWVDTGQVGGSLYLDSRLFHDFNNILGMSPFLCIMTAPKMFDKMPITCVPTEVGYLVSNAIFSDDSEVPGLNEVTYRLCSRNRFGQPNLRYNLRDVTLAWKLFDEMPCRNVALLSVCCSRISEFKTALLSSNLTLAGDSLLYSLTLHIILNEITWGNSWLENDLGLHIFTWFDTGQILWAYLIMFYGRNTLVVMLLLFPFSLHVISIELYNVLHLSAERVEITVKANDYAHHRPLLGYFNNLFDIAYIVSIIDFPFDPGTCLLWLRNIVNLCKMVTTSVGKNRQYANGLTSEMDLDEVLTVTEVLRIGLFRGFRIFIVFYGRTSLGLQSMLWVHVLFAYGQKSKFGSSLSTIQEARVIPSLLEEVTSTNHDVVLWDSESVDLSEFIPNSRSRTLNLVTIFNLNACSYDIRQHNTYARPGGVKSNDTFESPGTMYQLLGESLEISIMHSLDGATQLRSFRSGRAPKLRLRHQDDRPLAPPLDVLLVLFFPCCRNNYQQICHRKNLACFAQVTCIYQRGVLVVYGLSGLFTSSKIILLAKAASDLDDWSTIISQEAHVKYDPHHGKYFIFNHLFYNALHNILSTRVLVVNAPDDEGWSRSFMGTSEIAHTVLYSATYFARTYFVNAIEQKYNLKVIYAATTATETYLRHDVFKCFHSVTVSRICELLPRGSKGWGYCFGRAKENIHSYVQELIVLAASTSLWILASMEGVAIILQNEYQRQKLYSRITVDMTRRMIVVWEETTGIDGLVGVLLLKTTFIGNANGGQELTLIFEAIEDMIYFIIECSILHYGRMVTDSNTLRHPWNKLKPLGTVDFVLIVHQANHTKAFVGYLVFDSNLEDKVLLQDGRNVINVIKMEDPFRKMTNYVWDPGGWPIYMRRIIY